MSRQPDPAVFRQHAVARLQAGATLYGDASYQRPARELLYEILEELVDVAAWGTIALAVIQRDPELASEDRAAVSAAIIEASDHAEQSYGQILAASRMLAGADAGSPEAV